ncbi:arsenate reductase (glutaredoxin) [Nitrincola sp. MINF-07-Sa-05]|uniref:arsenate reductase (glutaredoxin) n=1 Tax=Nitrincola salilacus TaxID=3400273 RepID=UPI003917D2FA
MILYHNPRCSKSRQTLELLQSKGVEPEVREYLKDVPSVDELKQVLKALEIAPRELLRRKEDEYKIAGLEDMSLSDEDVIEAMTRYPKLIERPILINGDKARIGRPPEAVLEILA